MGKIKATLNSIAGWFQPTYNAIDKWDCPVLREICRDLWEIIDERAKRMAYDLIRLIYEQAKARGAEYAEKQTKEVVAALKKFYINLSK